MVPCPEIFVPQGQGTTGTTIHGGSSSQPKNNRLACLTPPCRPSLQSDLLALAIPRDLTSTSSVQTCHQGIMVVEPQKCSHNAQTSLQGFLGHHETMSCGNHCSGGHSCSLQGEAFLQ